MRRVAIIRQSVPIVSLQRVAFDAQAIVMPAGMALTLNGVVQGFIADKVAVLLAAEGLTESALVPVLEERRGEALVFDMDGMRWRDHVVPLHRIVHARHTLAAAFGSCSFQEPCDDLRELALL